MDTEAAVLNFIPLFLAFCIGCAVFSFSKKYAHLVAISIAVFLLVIVPIAIFLEKSDKGGFLHFDNLYFYFGIAISIMAFILSNILFVIRYFWLKSRAVRQQ